MLGYFVYKQFRQLLNFAFNGSVVNLGSYPLTAELNYLFYVALYTPFLWVEK